MKKSTKETKGKDRRMQMVRKKKRKVIV